MTPAARCAAAIDILDRILAGDTAERAITAWGRASRYAGSGDRAAVRDIVFDGLRRRRSAAALGGSETGRGIVLGLLRQDGHDPATIFTGEGHAPPILGPHEQALGTPASDAVAHDLPDWLWPVFRDDLGPDASRVAGALRHRAPVFLRVNLAKTTREAAIAALAVDGIGAVPHPDVRTALEVTDNPRKIQSSSAYQEGLVELQDASSQAAVLALPLAGKSRILDYCAGGGGKALALAALTDGLILAHDIDPGRMTDLPKRAARAGARIETCATRALHHRAPFDLVLVDAPCSGSGTWRRAPEAKWATSSLRLSELQAMQDVVLASAADLTAPGGILAYATCSVLRGENRDRVDRFLAVRPGWTLKADHSWLPGPAGDGFYLAVLAAPAHTTGN